MKFDPQKSLENLADLRRMDVSLRDLAEHFHVPKEWILLERTVLLLMGLCTELDPTLNPMEVIRPYLEEFVLGKDRDWSMLFVDTTKDIAGERAGAAEPRSRRSLQKAQRGELEVRFRGIDEHARLIYALGHQIIYAALGITAGAFAMVFDGRHEPDAGRATAWYGAGAFAHPARRCRSCPRARACAAAAAELGERRTFSGAKRGAGGRARRSCAPRRRAASLERHAVPRRAARAGCRRRAPKPTPRW